MSHRDQSPEGLLLGPFKISFFKGAGTGRLMIAFRTTPLKENLEESTGYVITLLNKQNLITCRQAGLSITEEKKQSHGSVKNKPHSNFEMLCCASDRPSFLWIKYWQEDISTRNEVCPHPNGQSWILDSSRLHRLLNYTRRALGLSAFFPEAGHQQLCPVYEGCFLQLL